MSFGLLGLASTVPNKCCERHDWVAETRESVEVPTCYDASKVNGCACQALRRLAL